MKVIVDEIEREVFITRKNNKNSYLKVGEDLNIYITTNYLTSDNYILELINNNTKYITKMTNLFLKKKELNKKFYYLGKEYDIIYFNETDILLGNEKVFLKKDFDLDKWYIKQAKEIFKEELDRIYKQFPINIPNPSLTIRKMKTRWGVCNVKTNRITLNLELIKRDIKYLDYVIVHELSHLVYANHSAYFWNLVSVLVPNYKTLRKELNNYEYD